MTATSNVIKAVLVGVDGSDTSLKAVEWAAHEALRRNATLEVRVCYSVPFYGEPGTFGAYAVESQVDSIKIEHEQIAVAAGDVARQVAPQVDVRTTVVFASASINLTEVDLGTMLVVGASGRTGVIAGVLGSVTTAVVHRAKVPVVVVPQNTNVSEGSTMKKIVVGIDGSPTSEHALHWALDEARLAGAELTVVHGWSYPYTGGPRDEIKANAMDQLEATIKSVSETSVEGVAVHAKLVEGHPAEALIDEGRDADLLVVGSRGRGGFKAMLLGSVSRAVVQHSTCPVAVIRHRPE